MRLWDIAFSNGEGSFHSCQRNWQSVHLDGATTHFSSTAQRLLSATALYYGMCRWVSGQNGKTAFAEGWGMKRASKDSFLAPFSQSFKNDCIAAWCCLLPRERRVTSKAEMLSPLHANLADSSGCSTRVSLRCTEHFRWWLTALPDICMIISLYSACYSADSTAHKKQIGASWAAAPGG